jgi:CRISPR/Cas system-associated endonuclease Cas1
VLDLMEPQRPLVDPKVLEFVQSNTFHRRISRSEAMGCVGLMRRWPKASFRQRRHLQMFVQGTKMDGGRSNNGTRGSRQAKALVY